MPSSAPAASIVGRVSGALPGSPPSAAGGTAAIGYACPRCRTALEDLRCPACGCGFPAPEGIPWLFADPINARADWRNRYEHAQRRLEAERARAAHAVAVQEATRRRLERLVTGQSAYLAEIDALLGASLGATLGEGLDTGGDAVRAPLESHVALRTRLPATQGLLTYESNVFRDWCWGDAENAAALDEVLAVLGSATPRRVLVLGSGAGRLAYDLHQALPVEVTVALDLNPLLACVGQRVSRGEAVTLTEFPLVPRRPEDVAVARRLAAPAPARPGLAFVLGDALRAPFLAGAFDLVVTPWLLDILEAPPQTLIAEVNRLLAPDGAWIYHGSVAFGHADPGLRFTAEELMETAPGLGFAVAARREADLPYLCCPDSRHGRVEQVLTFRADRRSACSVAPVPDDVPAWIADPALPIPALPAFRSQALATRTHAYIMSLIDGARSLGDIARVLARHGLMDEAGARAALVGFLTTMHDEASRSRGF
jgi:SAM-dependent methyltransferase